MIAVTSQQQLSVNQALKRKLHIPGGPRENTKKHTLQSPYKANKTVSQQKNLEKARRRKTTSIKEIAKLAGECGLLSATPLVTPSPTLAPSPPTHDTNSLFTCFYGRHFVTLALQKPVRAAVCVTAFCFLCCIISVGSIAFGFQELMDSVYFFINYYY